MRERKLENVDVIKSRRDRYKSYGKLLRSHLHATFSIIFQRPARTDAANFRTLKPGGLVAVIEFAPRPTL
ncbi:MAG: hypothetical protein ACR2JB_25685 [Bryobacteraceae bacterium]